MNDIGKLQETGKEEIFLFLCAELLSVIDKLMGDCGLATVSSIVFPVPAILFLISILLPTASWIYSSANAEDFHPPWSFKIDLFI